MELGTSHPELRTRASKAQAAAADHDLARLRREVTHLMEAFVRHTELETAELEHLPPSAAQRLRRGQTAVSDAIRALVDEAESGSDMCRCERLATEVATLIELQGDTERRTFSHENTRP
jgi:hypothetical protein